MEKKTKFGDLVSGVGKGARDLLNKSKDAAIRMADQNDDGKLNREDAALVAEAVGTTVKKGMETIRKTADETARMLELKSLQPIFPDSLAEPDFFMPKFIRVAERDKKHAESEVCQGSIGFVSEQKGLTIVNIFLDAIAAFGLTFYPDADSEFYYVDPSDRNNYIALNEYFSHLKIVRINELQKLAQELGAKHFKVTYKEEQRSLSEKKANIRGDAKKAAYGEVSGEVNQNYSDK